MENTAIHFHVRPIASSLGVLHRINLLLQALHTTSQAANKASLLRGLVPELWSFDVMQIPSQSASQSKKEELC